MPTCSTNYVCTPVWYDSSDTDVIAYAAGPHAVDLNITCFVELEMSSFRFEIQMGIGSLQVKLLTLCWLQTLFVFQERTCQTFVFWLLGMPSFLLKGLFAEPRRGSDPCLSPIPKIFMRSGLFLRFTSILPSWKADISTTPFWGLIELSPL